MRLQRGFTLIELLIVIAIIGILIGLLFPVLRGAQLRSRQAACTNNLYQFGLAAVQYRYDHEGEMPPWLSSLYPEYMPAKSSYLCPSDHSRGREGSKPDDTHIDIGGQYPETDDITSNAAANREPAIKVCSYMYEFCDTECYLSLSGWLCLGSELPATEEAIDTNSDGVLTWREIKVFQLKVGDLSFPRGYSEAAFPMIRCFHHHDERDIVANNYDDEMNLLGTKKDHLTLNTAYAGNVFQAPLKWEEKR